MAELQSLHRVLMQELCSSLADKINDSIDLISLRAFCAVIDEVGYQTYQQSISRPGVEYTFGRLVFTYQEHYSAQLPFFVPSLRSVLCHVKTSVRIGLDRTFLASPFACRKQVSTF